MQVLFVIQQNSISVLVHSMLLNCPFLHELLLIRVTHAYFLLSTTSGALDTVTRQTQHGTMVLQSNSNGIVQ